MSEFTHAAVSCPVRGLGCVPSPLCRPLWSFRMHCMACIAVGVSAGGCGHPVVPIPCSVFAAVLVCGVGLGLCAVPPSQLQALTELYEGTAGPAWTGCQWDVATDPCEAVWCGVTCDPDNLTVSGLVLVKNGLTGALPHAIGNLRDLTYAPCVRVLVCLCVLCLCLCSLPPSLTLCVCPLRSTLEISGNSGLVGQIPLEITNFVNLV